MPCKLFMIMERTNKNGKRQFVGIPYNLDGTFRLEFVFVTVEDNIPFPEFEDVDCVCEIRTYQGNSYAKYSLA